MTQQVINIGAAGNDHTGDPTRTYCGKINANFAELYAMLPWPFIVVAAEDLVANDPVHLTVTGSPPQLLMEKADATDTTKPADGFVIANVANGIEGGFYPLGIPMNSPDSPAPFTVGTRYFVAVGGGLTATMPSTTLNGQQEIGIAISDTELLTYRSPMNEAP